MFVADTLAAWLLGLLADAGRKRLTTFVLGSEQERALRSAATKAVQFTADELRPDDDERADELAMVINQVFGDAAPGASLAGHATVLEALQAGIAGQIAVLDDASLTGTGQSSADLLAVPATVVAAKLTGHLLREIVARGSRGGPLTPLAGQLNHDLTHLQGQRIEGQGQRIEGLLTQVLDRLGDGLAQPVPRLIASGTPARILPPRPAARSAYRKQVERIAPPKLFGREAELQELAAYCTEPGRGPYAWWRAPEWAGKSALMSTFVLHPPARVQIVAFFITDRLADQNTREAFSEVVLEQLAELRGQDLPAWTAATRDHHLLEMLEHAAQACDDQGERLILIVDGLDEDRGATTGPGAHSIAGLMPDNPSAGMRIVVAGRPNPPIPDDVPGWHPLHDPGIVRQLAPSPYARDVEKLAQRELRHLLAGTPANRDLVGLLTAAQGGLSGPDLAHLTGEPPWEIEALLHGVSGRTFTRRVSQWQPGAGPEVYLLGHEQLQATARAYLGEQRLAGYRDRLHAWSQEYQAQSWPDGTPEYLLRGYFQMLTATGDITRMVACATDTSRHQRMSDITGGDAIALNEVITTLDLITGDDAPDLTAALKLARHRDRLADRNTNIPSNLPAVWATLGHYIRAEALARSITEPGWRVRALAEVARALAEAGQREQAITLAAEAEAETEADTEADGSSTSSVQQWIVLPDVARALAAAGQAEQAVAVARSLADSPEWPRVLGEVARALAGAGQREQAIAVAAEAETAARSITAWYSQGPLSEMAWVLGEVARALAGAGQREHAIAVAADAETTARSITSRDGRAWALVPVVRALAETGQREHAIAVAAEAETTARSLTHLGEGATLLGEVARALAEAGQAEQAIAVARACIIRSEQAEAQFEQAEAARALAGAGQDEQVTALARASIIRREVPETQRVAARALARAGQAEQAIAVARSITGRGERAREMGEVARALAGAGQREQAITLAAEAETAARSLTSRDEPAWVLGEVARALAEAGQREQAITLAAKAETAARSLTDPGERIWALSEVARALAWAGQREQAIAVAAEAETPARSVTDPGKRERLLGDVAWVLAAAGQAEQALAVARDLTDPGWRERVLGTVGWRLAEAGQYDEAIAVARSVTDPGMRAETLAAAARALAGAGQREQAIALAAEAETPARSLTDPGERVRVLAEVAWALAGAGQHEQAILVAAEAETTARSLTGRYERPLVVGEEAEALAEVAWALAGAGQREQAIAAAALAEVAWALAGAGQREQAIAVAAEAETTARSLTDQYQYEREQVLGRVAQALAEAGQHEQAIAIARAITRPDGRAAALTAIAETLATRGDTRQARQVASAACAAGRWTTALRLVLSLEPSAAGALTDL